MRFIISFDAGTMIVSDEDLPEVSENAHRVVREAQQCGAWVTGGGLFDQPAMIVQTDGSVAQGPWPESKAVIGGFSIVDVASLDEAVEWAKKTAVACRCPQEVRELMDDPEV
jgi:hypothetical protein